MGPGTVGGPIIKISLMIWGIRQPEGRLLLSSIDVLQRRMEN